MKALVTALLVLTSISSAATANPATDAVDPSQLSDPRDPNCQPSDQPGNPIVGGEWIQWTTPNILESWQPKNFSDPRAHDPRRFRYIVHAIYGLDNRKYSAAQTMDYIDRSRSQALHISASVIDQTRSGTYGKTGFILKVPVNSMVAVTTLNAVTRGATNRTLACRLGLRNSPQEIMSQTTPDEVPGLTHNELVIDSNPSRPVQVIGMFIADNAFVDPDDAREIIALAKERNLPLVHLTPTPKNDDSK